MNSSQTHFTENFNYVVSEIYRMKERKLSMPALGKIFGFPRLTIFNWIHGEYLPKSNSLLQIVAKTNELLNWNISVDDFKYTLLKERFPIDESDKEIAEIEFRSREANLDDVTLIGSRIRKLRDEKGWSLKITSQKTRDLFPNNPERQVSHTHIREMENGLVTNFNVHKIKGLATVFRVPVGYLMFGWEPITRPTIDRSQGVLLLPIDDFAKTLDDTALEEYVKRAYHLIKEMMKFDKVGSV